MGFTFIPKNKFLASEFLCVITSKAFYLKHYYERLKMLQFFCRYKITAKGEKKTGKKQAKLDQLISQMSGLTINF